jgi:hypothetical protein
MVRRFQITDPIIFGSGTALRPGIFNIWCNIFTGKDWPGTNKLAGSVHRLS